MVQGTSSKTLYSGALARAAAVSPDTIRHYEKIGVLPRASRTQSGYRVYPASALDRVLVVQRALLIGFTLGELAGNLHTVMLEALLAVVCTSLLKRSSRASKPTLKRSSSRDDMCRRYWRDWVSSVVRVRVRGSHRTCCIRSSDSVKNSGITANQFRRKKIL